MNPQELHRKLNQKKVILGHNISDPIKNSLYKISTFGVQIFTDSQELYKQFKLTTQYSNEQIQQPLLANFYYLTNYEKQGSSNSILDNLAQMNSEYAGDIFCNTDLSNFFFKGPEKYGTAIGMICGIRALSIIDKGWLGLHASCIYDSKVNKVHILIGESQSGKSAFSHLLTNNSNRYKLLSDDWCEINLFQKEMTARPITKFVSEGETGNLVFESYGKQFFLCDHNELGNEFKVDKILLIHCSKKSIVNDKEFIKNTLHHIPFIPQIFDKLEFNSVLTHQVIEKLSVQVQSKYNAIVSIFQKIKSSENCYDILNLKDERTFEQVYEEIISKLNS